MLFNIKTLEWDKEILEELNIPESMLPEVKNSSEIYGYTDEATYGGAQIAIGGIQATQTIEGRERCFVLMNTGDKVFQSKNGLLTTIAWGLNGEITYALEGSVFVAGAAIQWLRDELRLVYDSPQTEYYADKIEDTGGVYVVPAFTGLGAPYWDMYARGGIFGLTRGTKREHLVRATLESLAYQSKDVIEAMKEDTGIQLANLRVDGGASANDFLMQFQADMLNTEIYRPKTLETTALGAAYFAGLAVGLWKDLDEIYDDIKIDKKFISEMSEETRAKNFKYWKKAVERTMGWEED